MSTEYQCTLCGLHFTKDNNEPPYSIQGNTAHNNYDILCDTCYPQFVTCAVCGELVVNGHCYHAYDTDNITRVFVCRDCRRTLHRCCECGTYLTANAEHININSSNDIICRHCRDYNFHECAMCGTVVSNRTYQVNGQYVTDLCYSCVRRHYRECNHCGNNFTSDNMTMIDGYGYCNDCATNYADTCNDCGERTFDSHATTTGRSVCPQCASMRYQYCDDCDAYAPHGHCHARMRNYSYKPNPIFHGKDDNGLFYGIEIEAESTEGERCNETASELVSMFSDNEQLFYVKSDSSLNDGLEVVTHPHTITKITKASWLTNVLEYLDNHGYKSHDTSTCGLHVHISKSAFIDAMHQTRFAWFIYESAFTVPIARRSFNSYCRKVNKHLSDNTPDNTSSTRYEAVNFENRHTVEVRIFKGTLKPTTVYITLQYLDAVFHYTETVRLPMLASPERDDNFLKFIKHKPKYGKLFYHLTHLPNTSH